MFHEVWELERFQTAKVTFRVMQGHWQWFHSMAHIRLPISLPLKLCLYLASLTRYYHLVPKILGGHVTLKTSLLEVIYHACTSIISIQNLKCLASPILKIWLGQHLKKRSRDPDHTHYGAVCNPKASTWYILPAYKILRLSLHPFRRYDCGDQNWKWVTWPWPRPFRGGL